MMLFANIRRALSTSRSRQKDSARLISFPSVLERIDQNLDRLRVKNPVCPERADEFKHRGVLHLVAGSLSVMTLGDKSSKEKATAPSKPKAPNFTSRILEGLNLRRGLVELREGIGIGCRRREMDEC